jgi:hypothetical protein
MYNKQSSVGWNIWLFINIVHTTKWQPSITATILTPH